MGCFTVILRPLGPLSTILLTIDSLAKSLSLTKTPIPSISVLATAMRKTSDSPFQLYHTSWLSNTHFLNNHFHNSHFHNSHFHNSHFHHSHLHHSHFHHSHLILGELLPSKVIFSRTFHTVGNLVANQHYTTVNNHFISPH